MLKYVSKFFLEIFPSIIATVVGAYIVNHYIISKPDADAPKAAVASTPDPAKDMPAKDITAVRAEQAGESDKMKQAEKPAEKASAEKAAADKSSGDKEAKRQANAREKNEKAMAKTAPAVNAQPAPVTVSIATPDAASASEENRDANEIARAALDRLRGPVEAARQPDAPRVPTAAVRPAEPPRVIVAATPPQIQQPQVQQTVQPLPPAVLVTPPNAATQPGTSGVVSLPEAPAAKHERSFASFRLSPPADIPATPPLDLQAVSRGHTSVTEDVVSAAKSVFHAVIPR